jgi:cardiolipin synthase
VTDLYLWLGFFVLFLEVCGIACAFHALLYTRTSQGAIAWSLFLVAMPVAGLPVYLIFGRNKFHGYVDARRVGTAAVHEISRSLIDYEPEHMASFDPEESSYGAFQKMTRMPLTRRNTAELLIDGEATFNAIFEGIASAKEYILVQFFIIRDDQIGRELKRRLIARSNDGIKIYVLYDEMGSHWLRHRYIRELKRAGIEVRPFRTQKGITNKFQLNFRNHRKIVVIDGHTTYIGGLNVGDEYMGRSKKFGPWRDTHVKVAGPAAIAAQLSFTEDWYWATNTVPELKWVPKVPAHGDKRVLVLPSGPADTIETCNLLFVHAIHSAQKELWISSPYFVPDRELVGALQLAALRGVDVRILLPAKPDHLMVYLASFSFLEALDMDGISFYRYQPGFLHQKVILADEIAIVGTANCDNRSFRLNFEISLLFADVDFANEVRAMLEKDFSNSIQVGADSYTNAPLYFKAGVRFARLFSPIL